MNYSSIASLCLFISAHSISFSMTLTKEAPQSLPKHGGIQSIVTATKDDTLLYVIGLTDYTSLAKGPLFPADEDAKVSLIKAFKQWSMSTEPITFINPTSQSYCKESAERFSRLHPSNYFPCREAINAIVHNTNGKHGSLIFECAEATETQYSDYEHNISLFLSDVIFCALASRVKFPAYTPKAVDEVLALCTPEKRKLFFSEYGPFQEFSKTARGIDGIQYMSINNYCKFLQELEGKITQYLTQTNNAPLKRQLESAITTLKATIADAKFYAQVTPDCTMRSSLLTLLLHRLRTSLSFTDTKNEMLHLLILPYKYAAYCIDIAHIIHRAEEKKKVVTFLDHTTMLATINLLTASGYSVALQGNIPSTNSPDNNPMSKCPFNTQSLHDSFCSTLSVPTKNEKDSSNDDPLTPFLMHTATDKELLNALNPQRKTPQLSDIIYQHTTLALCYSCNRPINFDLIRCTHKTHNFCSVSCIKNNLIQELSSKNKTVLAALCYLWYLILSPTADLENGTLFSLKHDFIKKRLALHKDASLLKEAETLGINVAGMQIALNAYSKEKDAFYTLKLAHKKNGAATHVIFDPKNFIRTLQKKFMRDLAIKFITKEPITYPQLYYALACELAQDEYSPNLLKKSL